MMKNKKMYVISEDAYHNHIDDKVHLYGLLRQLAFCAAKAKTPLDAARLEENAILFGQIAEDMFKTWNIPGRYLVYGDTADLEALKEKELFSVDADFDDETEDEYWEYDDDDFFEIFSDLLSRLENIMSGLESILSELDTDDE